LSFCAGDCHGFFGAFDTSDDTALTPTPGRFSVVFGLNKPGRVPMSPNFVSSGRSASFISASPKPGFADALSTALLSSKIMVEDIASATGSGTPSTERRAAHASGVNPR
jgi:hypothetical protein